VHDLGQKGPHVTDPWRETLAALGWTGVLRALATTDSKLVHVAELFGAQRAVIKAPNYARLSLSDAARVERGLRYESAVLAIAGDETPHVPRLLAGDPDGRFLIRTFADGSPLSDRQTSGAAPRTMIGALIRLAADLFPRFHGRQPEPFIIRDFKPINIIWNDADERMILIDLGSVRPASRARARTLAREPRLGSGRWLYWAPEQLLNRAALPDQRADFFALAATAHYLLTGSAPFSNSEPSEQIAFANYLSEYPATVVGLRSAALSAGLLDDVTRFLERCLHPAPEQRATMKELEALL